MNQRRVLAVRLAVKFNQAKNSVESLALSELSVYYSAKPHLLPGIHSRCSGNGWVIFAGSVTVVLISETLIHATLCTVQCPLNDFQLYTSLTNWLFDSLLYVTLNREDQVRQPRWAPRRGGSVGRGDRNSAILVDSYWCSPRLAGDGIM